MSGGSDADKSYTKIVVFVKSYNFVVHTFVI
jgi:flagellar capping protein FliD